MKSDQLSRLDRINQTYGSTTYFSEASHSQHSSKIKGSLEGNQSETALIQITLKVQRVQVQNYYQVTTDQLVFVTDELRLKEATNLLINLPVFQVDICVFSFKDSRPKGYSNKGQNNTKQLECMPPYISAIVFSSNKKIVHFGLRQIERICSYHEELNPS